MKAQAKVRRSLGVPDTRFHGQLSSEENWRWLFRVEVKSGQQVKAMATRFLEAERQANANTAMGDPRPFLFAASPAGWGDGLVCLRLADWQIHVAPFLPDSL